jgi:kinesin family protein 5
LEIKSGGEVIVSFADNQQTLSLRSTNLSTGPERDGFVFDRVFPMDTMQQEVFDYGVKE